MSTLVGKNAPDFWANAVVNGVIEPEFSLCKYRGENYAILFFYPKDFTFVCPTEIIAFQKALPEFESRGAKIIGCSTDSEFSHLAWVNTPRNKGGIEGVTYPLVSDINKTISKSYGVLSDTGDFVAYRGLFLIDKGGIIRHEVVNDFPLGRSIDEEIRMLDALKHFEEKGEVCPMNWKEGEPAMKPSKEGVSNYLSEIEE